MFLVLLAQAPPPESKELFFKYAEVEEKYGLGRSAMEVYDRAVRTVPLPERYAVYEVYLARAQEFFGLGKVHLDLCPSGSFLRFCPCMSGAHVQQGWSENGYILYLFKTTARRLTARKVPAVQTEKYMCAVAGARDL